MSLSLFCACSGRSDNEYFILKMYFEFKWPFKLSESLQIVVVTLPTWYPEYWEQLIGDYGLMKSIEWTWTDHGHAVLARV